ncbi:uncharacterized protein LOC135821360 [Sycon ciliatum]|uniref:uncharacterized protein LOC135821360 n=1 Tax=Sycon ciliatum TaxID=27933 RepID=UPI0031F66E95
MPMARCESAVRALALLVLCVVTCNVLVSSIWPMLVASLQRECPAQATTAASAVTSADVTAFRTTTASRAHTTVPRVRKQKQEQHQQQQQQQHQHQQQQQPQPWLAGVAMTTSNSREAYNNVATDPEADDLEAMAAAILQEEIERLQQERDLKLLLVTQLETEVAEGDVKSRKEGEGTTRGPLNNAASTAVLPYRQKYDAFADLDENATEVHVWSAFDRAFFFDRGPNPQDPPSGRLTRARRVEVELVVRTSVKSLPELQGRGNATPRATLLFGYKQTARHLGTRYDLYFQLSTEQGTSVQRVQLIRPLGDLILHRDKGFVRAAPSKASSRQRTPRLHVLVPASTRGQLHRLSEFIAHLVNTTAASSRARQTWLLRTVTFTLIVMTTDKRTLEHVTNVVRNSVGEASLADRFNVAFINASEFDWRLAIKRLPSRHAQGGSSDDTEDILAVLETDHLASPTTLQRCLAMVSSGKRAFWPVPLRLYNPRLVPMATMRGKRLKVANGLGTWQVDDFSAFCMARSDVASALGAIQDQHPSTRSTNTPELGELLFKHGQRSAAGQVRMMRAPEPTLFRQYRPMKCTLPRPAPPEEEIPDQGAGTGDKIRHHHGPSSSSNNRNKESTSHTDMTSTSYVAVTAQHNKHSPLPVQHNKHSPLPVQQHGAIERCLGKKAVAQAPQSVLSQVYFGPSAEKEKLFAAEKRVMQALGTS